jgi:hypothetical protein
LYLVQLQIHASGDKEKAICSFLTHGNYLLQGHGEKYKESLLLNYAYLPAQFHKKKGPTRKAFKTMLLSLVADFAWNL